MPPQVVYIPHLTELAFPHLACGGGGGEEGGNSKEMVYSICYNHVCAKKLKCANVTTTLLPSVAVL